MEKRVKIRHPFDKETNKCFGCGPQNPIGLRLTFEETESHLHASWEPSEIYQGYANILHGGIIATLLDEIGAWCINVKSGTSAVTQSMTVRYLKPVYISKGTITLDAEIINNEGPRAKLLCRLLDGDKRQCAEADIEYFLYPEALARKRYLYPGQDAFYFDEDEDTEE